MKANVIYNYQTSIRDFRRASGINAVESIVENVGLIFSKLAKIYICGGRGAPPFIPLGDLSPNSLASSLINLKLWSETWQLNIQRKPRPA